MNLRLHRQSPARRVALGLAGAAAWLVACAGSLAQSVTMNTLPSTVTAENYRVKFDNNRLSVRDLISGRDLVKDDHAIMFVGGECDSDLKVEAKADGVDLIVTAKNESGDEKKPPSLLVSRMMFGDIDSWNFRHGSRKVAIQFPAFNSTYSVMGMVRADYPSDSYSPIIAFSDATHSVGVSVMYDAVAYDHSVFVDLVAAKPSPSTPGPGYFTTVTFNGKVPARTTRTYRVSVRFARQGQSWLKTLVPYRDWFRQQYGGVQYVADRRPVWGSAFADGVYVDSTNPRGFGFPRARPDIHGYEQLVTAVLGILNSNGYQRMMLWAISGLNMNHPDLNNPYTFATGVDSMPALQQTANELTRLGAGGRDVGFWWGNSVRVTTPAWDSGNMEMFDPGNYVHVEAAYREMDRAIQLGATTIGLDAFVMASPGAQYRLLYALRQKYPNIKFLSEVSGCDYLHTMAGTWHYAIDVAGPDYLAQFLVPGHETWAGTNARHWNHNSLALDIAKTEQIASWGFTILDGIGLTNRLSFRGTDVSQTAVPPELYLPPAPPRVGYQPNLAAAPVVTPPPPPVVNPPVVLPPPPPPLPGENPQIPPQGSSNANTGTTPGGSAPSTPGGAPVEFTANITPSDEMLAGARGGGGGGGGGGISGGGGGGGMGGMATGGASGGGSSSGVSDAGTGSGAGAAAGGENGAPVEAAPPPPVKAAPTMILSPEAQKRLEKKKNTDFAVPSNARGNRP